MITPKILSETALVIGPCRLSYCYLNAARIDKNTGKAEKFSCDVLVPKTEKQTIKALEKAIENAIAAGVVAKWNGKRPAKLGNPLHDGDTEKNDSNDAELYENHKYFNPKTDYKPVIYDFHTKAPITDEEEIYSGMYALVSVNFKAYDSNGNRGVQCFLNGISKFKDGDKLGGSRGSAQDFDNIEIDEDINDDDL